MFQKLKGVVLHSVKYSDKNSIVHVFTDAHGRMPFLLPQGGSKTAMMRNALFMPLSIIEFDANIVSGREIYTLKEVRSLYPFSSIYSDPVKNAIVMFITELLGKVIQGREQNTALFRYIATAVQFLDRMDKGTSNFHICFLYNLGAFLGIQPDIESYREGYWFDMLNGEFTPLQPTHSNILTTNDAKTIVMLSRITFSNLNRFTFNRTQRNEVLNMMLKYYKLHNTTIGSLKSPEILKQLFQ